MKVANLARGGIEVSSGLAAAIVPLNLTTVSPDLRDLLTVNETGTFRKLKEGDSLKQPQLAEVLQVTAVNKLPFFK